MRSLFDLWVDGGPLLYLLLLLFLLVALALLVQLALARKVVFPKLFTGGAVMVAAMALITTAVGYRMSFDVAFTHGLEAGLTAKANEIALTSILFGSGMLLVLALLQLGVEALRTQELARMYPADRVTSLLVLLAVSSLTIGGYLLFRGVITANGVAAMRNLDGPIAKAISDRIMAAIVTGVVTALLAFATMVGSVVSAIRGRRSV